MAGIRHGYTNATRIAGERVKRDPTDAAERMRAEVDAIHRTAGRVPAPEVVHIDGADCVVTFRRLLGRHGQELIDEGHAVPSLGGGGPHTSIAPRRLQPPTWTHGDDGPQNLLYDSATLEVTAVLDWEFARLGDPVDDLAWAEWIVRMHHAGAAASDTSSKGGESSRNGNVAKQQCSPPATGSETGPRACAMAGRPPYGR